MKAKRKRISVKVGELGEFMKLREQRLKKMFSEVVRDLMDENSCTWTEAKKLHKFNRIEKSISRELQNI